MKKNIFSYLGNITLIIGAAAGLYALVRIFIVSSSLPPGVCPVVNYQPLIYTAIAFCVLSFVFSLLEQRAKKKAAQQDNGQT